MSDTLRLRAAVKAVLAETRADRDTPAMRELDRAFAADGQEETRIVDPVTGGEKGSKPARTFRGRAIV